MTTFSGCFKQATGEDDVTSLDGEDMYYWGLNQKDGTIPLKFSIQNEITKVEKMGQTSYDISYGNKITNDIEVPNVPMINCLPYFAVLGKQTEVTLDQRRTISHLTSIRKPRYQNAIQLDDLHPQIRYGTLFHTLRVSHAIGEPVTFSMNGIGCKPDRADVTFNSVSYPSDETKPFDILTHFKVGADGSESSIDGVKLVEFGAVQSISSYIGKNGYPEYINDFSSIDTYISVTMEGAQNTIMDNAEDKDEVSILWKVTKSAASTRYFEVDSNGATACIASMVPIALRTGEVIGWNNIFKLEKPTIDANDYLDTDFYTIPT